MVRAQLTDEHRMNAFSFRLSCRVVPRSLTLLQLRDRRDSDKTCERWDGVGEGEREGGDARRSDVLVKRVHSARILQRLY